MKPSSILVVDDEPDITSLLDSLLTQEGYRVETASNGEEGIQHSPKRRTESGAVAMQPGEHGSQYQTHDDHHQSSGFVFPAIG